MRYYKIVVSDPTGLKPTRTWTSLNSDGSYNSGAQNIEFDIPIASYATPLSAAYVRIWGVSLADISQANNFNNFNIEVYGGMSKGLPLANPSQQGLLVQGTIIQAFGNWIGTTQTLDLMIMPQAAPTNITLNWPKGTELIPAIKQTLLTAFGGAYSVDTSGIYEQSGFVLTEDQIGYFDNIAQFASFIKQVSSSIKPVFNATGNHYAPPYSGMDILLQGNVIKLIDNSGVSSATPIQIQFGDLIGQPTWIGLYQLQFNCVLRADLTMGTFITMPQVVFSTLPSSYSQYRQRSAFLGKFQILGDNATIRHVGNFRQPDGQSWITTINCVQVAAQPPQLNLVAPSNSGFGVGNVA